MALNYFPHFFPRFFYKIPERNKIFHTFRLNSSMKDHLVLFNTNSHTAGLLLSDDFPHLCCIILVSWVLVPLVCLFRARV